MQNRTNAWKIPSFARYSMLWVIIRLMPNEYGPSCFYFIVWKTVIYKPKKLYGEFFNCNCSN